MSNEMHKMVLPDGDDAVTVSDAFKQLGDPTRLRIFYLLCHEEACVTDIADTIGMSTPAVSHHLRLLKTANLITSKRNGKEMYYRAADSELVSSLHHVVEQVLKITCPN